MTSLDDWTAQVSAALKLDPAMIDPTLILDIARDVAHGVARPAAPLTAYLCGLAVGRGNGPDEVAAAIREVLRTWNATGPRAGEPTHGPDLG